MAESDLIPSAQAGQGPAPAGGYGRDAIDYRRLQQPEEGIPLYRLANSGAAARAQELGRVFKEFGEQASSLSDKLATAQGARQGTAAGLDPNFKPKTGLEAVTAYGSAYDAAAHVSYVNGTHAQMENAFSQIEQDTAGDPVAFQTRAQAVADGIVKGAPDLYKPEIQNAAALRMQAGLTRTREQAIQTARSDAFESYTSTTDSRISSALSTAATLPAPQQAALVQKTIADNRTQLDALVQARAITPEKSAVLQNKFQDQMTQAVHDQYTTNTVNHFMDLARAGDRDAADRAMQQYLVDPANSDADRAAVTKQYLTAADAYSQLQSRVHANDIAAVGQSLVGNEKHPGASGPGIENQIHQLYKQSAISPEGLHSLLDQSMRNQLESIKDDSSNQLLDAALHGGTKLDPTNREVAKAADKYFSTHIAMSGAAPLSDQWTIGAASFARQTNIIPKSVTDQIRIGLISGGPQTAVQAAAAAERIRAANPQIDPYSNDPRSAAIANEINANLHAGMSATAAYQTAMQTIDRPRDQKEIIAKQYGAIIRQDPNGNLKALQSAMDAQVPGWFAHAPPPPVPMQAEYNRLVSTYYTLNQNIDSARSLAAKQVQTTWGVSHMNGAAELTKYPPERLGVTADIIRSDVAASVKSAGFTGDPAQVHLMPNANTDSSQGRNWSLVHTDPTTGLSDVLLDHNNRPLQYQVPAGADFAKARQALIEQKLTAAREQREQQRKTAAEQIPGEQELADFYLRHPSMDPH